jgi:predicted nucleotidyltransferase component of viral defense system
VNTSPAAIKNRLLQIHRTTKHPYNFIFERYTQERLLYRISRGPHAEHFLLKGGLLLTALTNRFVRATHDIDFAASADADPEAMRTMMAEAIATEVEPDGLTYDPSGIRAEAIKQQDEYGGVRLHIPGTFGEQIFSVQIDVGVGDKVLLPVAEFEYPTLIEGLPHPRMRAYSVESMIAEKLEAMASLGEINGRYKDFDDVVQLSRSRSFDAGALHLACSLTFETRGTDFSALQPMIAPEVANAERQRHWEAYVRREHAAGGDQRFADMLRELSHFAEGIFAFDRDGVRRVWQPASRTWSEVSLDATEAS